MAVLTPDTDLGHAALTMKIENFSTAHGSVYTDPVSPGISPNNPSTASRSGVSTRTGRTDDSTLNMSTNDPFLAQEATRQFVQDQQTYDTW